MTDVWSEKKKPPNFTPLKQNLRVSAVHEYHQEYAVTNQESSVQLKNQNKMITSSVKKLKLKTLQDDDTNSSI